MSEVLSESSRLERVLTGVSGLDTILQGGFVQGGIYLISGLPGTGKTILGNQIAFHQVASGERAVYVTLLAETHSRMLSHLQSLRFFRPEYVGQQLLYFSGYQVLEEQGLTGLLELLHRVLRDHRPSVLILDGLVSPEVLGESKLAFKRFISQLQVYIESYRCTVFMLTPSSTDGHAHYEHTMVDGLVELSDHLVGPRAVRELQVRKHRGGQYLGGRHIVEISEAGFSVHPRTEALLNGSLPASSEERSRMAFDIRRFDEMLHGGVLSGSTTMLLGVPGSGKTILGTHFLAAGAAIDQPGLYFGFHETPLRLRYKARELGMSFDAAIEKGLIEVLWQAPLEGHLDILAENLLEVVQRRHVQRLFIDGVEGFQEAAVYPQRTVRFFTALTNELRRLGVTTLFSMELHNLFGPPIAVPIEGVSAIVENIIFLRYVELRSQLYRLISILKMRESAYEPAIREFRITNEGIDVAATFESAEAILTGLARPLSSVGSPGTVDFDADSTR